MDEPTTIVKVGGSLFDLPDLGPRLSQFLNELNSSRLLLVPGGGGTVDAIRRLDQLQHLGEETCHWLALRALSLNAHFLAALLRAREKAVVVTVNECAEHWRRGDTAIIDAHAFVIADEISPDHLPHSWEVTSDSVAARLAHVLQAQRLVLLKSASLPSGIDWIEAGRLGLVDGYFAQIVNRKLPPRELTIQVVNFRQ